MLPADFARVTTGSLRSHRLRTFLAALAIAVGVAAVIILTSIGEGVRDYVLSEFMQFGTNLMVVSPGKVATGGASIGVFGTVRPLTIEDTEAVRRVPHVLLTNPATDGNAEISWGGRHRRVTVYGMGPDWPEVGVMSVRAGSFLPRDSLTTPRPLAVLGSKAKDELFGAENPLGKLITVGGRRFRVIGVMESKGQFVGMDVDDTVFIPVAHALEIFNREGLTGFHVKYDPSVPPGRIEEGIRRVMTARHGRDDVTITTQQQMIEVLGSVLGVLTFAVGALGGISLFVGGIGILSIMTIAVAERTAEIGLLRALGASRGQVLAIFLGEAALLAALGGALGLLSGAGLAQGLELAVEGLPVKTPWIFAVVAEGVAIAIGLVAGVVPAIRAARLDPVEALRAE
jgi:putative ABC transport system permease protein